MPKTSILDTLTEGQQLQLLSWLETFAIAEVVQKVAAPPPDGFGIKTYITSLRRFQARMNNEARVELLAGLKTSPGDSQLLLKSAQEHLLQHVLELTSSSPSTSLAISAAAKILAAQQEHELRVKEIQLRERKLQLEEERLQVQRQAVAADLTIKEAKVENSAATKQVNASVKKILREPDRTPSESSGSTE